MAAPSTDAYAFPFQPVRPLGALAAFRDLVNDPEDTRHVFRFFSAAQGRTGEASFRRFCASAYGQGVIANRQGLADTLTDRAMLEACGPGSFAAAYLHYLDSEGLDPLGVYEAAVAVNPAHYEMLERDYPQFSAYTWSMSLTHDLYHVLTGYGRNPLGEALLLVFTGVQPGSRGSRLLGAMAGLRIRSEIPRWPVGRMMRNAAAMARAAEPMPVRDLSELFALPLDEARAALSITPDPLYRDTLAAWTGPQPITARV
ncbi:MAG: ubiquinone biosynthesis protein COQ4 [Oceanicaulis sp.]|nr:ubiquinone biosynthesis protein COQ4 [Oceanicaulis sp.]